MARTDPELMAWLELLRTPQLGAARIRALVRAFGTAGAALASRGDWMHVGVDRALLSDGTRRELARAIAGDAEWLRSARCGLLRFTDDCWPALLDGIADPPAALFVRGDVGALWQPQVAVVGSRHATSGGLEHARDFASAFVARGLTVTSGFARGIDAAAHAAALRAGGSTIAVCGTGLDVDYPYGSAALADAVAANGALISEHPCGTPPLAGHFPQRNRLISGLSLGTLVIEAGLKSGSLITARLAADQGREVFAVPGSIRNPQARGCHALIRDGARLVESAVEVCDALAPMAAELATAIRVKLGGGAGERVGGRTQDRETETSRDELTSSGDRHTSQPAAAALKGEQELASNEVRQHASQPAAAALPGEQELTSSGDQHSSQLAAKALLAPLLEAIGFDAITLEKLLEVADLDISTVSARLLALELAGAIEALPGARYVRLR